MMNWVYLSPHYDDVVFSCGGIVWEQVQSGDKVEIWTIFSGDIPPEPLTPFAQELHERWGTEGTNALRREEDQAACKRLGAEPRYFDLPDCIYRRIPGSIEPLVHSRKDLFAPLHPAERGLVDGLKRDLLAALPVGARLVSPLTVGGHVDHRFVRAAAEAAGTDLWFYADYPYTVMPEFKFSLQDWVKPEFKPYHCRVSAAGLTAWQDAIAYHHSQISTFWENEAQMRAEIAQYHAAGGGLTLWQGW
jgi:LmbE family N-acetylglucosaminyl deacetylase